jgi:hypothetical protein
MLSGSCTTGKVTYRKALEKSAGATLGPEQLDKAADGFASLNCQGGTMTPRDQLLGAMQLLQQGAFLQKKTSADCASAFQTAMRLVSKVQPNDDDDTQVKQSGHTIRRTGPECFAKAGDCDAAWSAYKDAWRLTPNAGMKTDDVSLRRGFDSIVKKCRGQ